MPSWAPALPRVWATLSPKRCMALNVRIGSVEGSLFVVEAFGSKESWTSLAVRKLTAVTFSSLLAVSHPDTHGPKNKSGSFPIEVGIIKNTFLWGCLLYLRYNAPQNPIVVIQSPAVHCLVRCFAF